MCVMTPRQPTKAESLRATTFTFICNGRERHSLSAGIRVTEYTASDATEIFQVKVYR